MHTTHLLWLVFSDLRLQWSAFNYHQFRKKEPNPTFLVSSSRSLMDGMFKKKWSESDATRWRVVGEMDEGRREWKKTNGYQFLSTHVMPGDFLSSPTALSNNKFEPWDPRGISCCKPPGLERDYQSCVNNTQEWLPKSASSSPCETPVGEWDFCKLETREVRLLKRCRLSYIMQAGICTQTLTHVHM